MSRVADVILAALAVPMPCPVCSKPDGCECVRPAGHSDREDRAALIEAALQEYGLLAPVQDRHEETIEELAQWLAEVSQFPRYSTDGGYEGWRKILQSEADVDIATSHARTKVTGAEAQRLTQVRVILLRHVRATPPKV